MLSSGKSVLLNLPSMAHAEEIYISFSSRFPAGKFFEAQDTADGGCDQEGVA